MVTKVAGPHCGTGASQGATQRPGCPRALALSPVARRGRGDLAGCIGAIAVVVAGACVFERMVRLGGLRPGAAEAGATLAHSVGRAYERAIVATEAIVFAVLV